MAGAIPSAYTTGYNNKYPMFYVVRFTLSTGDTLTILSQKGISATYNGTLLSPDYNYVGGNQSAAYLAAEIDGREINGIGEIDVQMSVQDGGGISAIGESSIVILNQTRFDDFVSQFSLENREVEIWEGYDPPGHSVAIETDMLLKFKGILSDADKWDYQKYDLPCIDRRKLDNIIVPYNVVTKDIFPYAPEASIGKVLPILFGDYVTPGTEFIGEFKAYEMGKYNAPPSIMVDEGSMRYMVADHPVTFDSDLHFLMDDNDAWLGNFITGAFSIESNTYYTGIDNLKLADPICRISIRPKLPAYGNTVGDLSKIIDEDSSTYVNIPASGVMSFMLDRFSFSGTMLSSADAANIGGVACYLNISFSDRVGNITVNTMDSENNSVLETFTLNAASPGSQSFAVGFTAGVYGSQLLSDLLKRSWKISPTVGQSVKIRSVMIQIFARMRSADHKEVVVRRASANILGQYYKPEKRDWIQITSSVRSNVFPNVTGAMFGSWITGRGTGYADGDVIENPAYAIEWLLREKVGLGDANLNLTSFDVVGNTTDGTRKNWKIGASIGESRPVFEHIRQICAEFMLVLILTNRGIYKLVSLDAVAAGTETDFTLSNSHIIYDGIPQMRIEKTPIEKMRNRFDIRYFKNYATNKMDRNKYLKTTTPAANNLSSLTGSPRYDNYVNWNGTSESQYNVKSDYETELEYVRDDTTAEYVLKSLSDWMAYKRLTVKATILRIPTTLALEVGDHIKIDHELLGTIARNTVNFIITRINYPPVSKTSSPTMILECEELPNEFTGVLQIRRISDEMWGIN